MDAAGIRIQVSDAPADDLSEFIPQEFSVAAMLEESSRGDDLEETKRASFIGDTMVPLTAGKSRSGSMAELSDIGRAKLKQLQMMTKEQREEMEEFFAVFDTDGSGTMELHELRILMYALGFEFDIEEIKKLLEDVFTVSDEEVDEMSLSLHEFMLVMADKIAERDSPETLKFVFGLYDVEGRGKFGMKELRNVGRECGDFITDDDAQLIVEELDGDSDGQIDIHDWSRAFTRSHHERKMNERTAQISRSVGNLLD